MGVRQTIIILSSFHSNPKSRGPAQRHSLCNLDATGSFMFGREGKTNILVLLRPLQCPSAREGNSLFLSKPFRAHCPLLPNAGPSQVESGRGEPSTQEHNKVEEGQLREKRVGKGGDRAHRECNSISCNLV